MARVSAAEFAEKWGRKLKQATPDIQRGVKRVTVAPGAQAAAQAPVMLANLTARVADGTWQKNVGAVSLQDWQKATLDKGVNRISAGVDGSMQKTQDMAEKLLAAVDAATAVVNRTPRGDLETNIQRSVTMQREMAARAPSRNR